MRLAIWLVAALAAVVGALYGVGRFLLPNTLEVTQSVEIDRPRAAIFAMANDLRIAREWSPYYARDPDAEYTFSGDGPGPGQAMRWSSRNRDVGPGRMTIVAATANQNVDAILQLRDNVTLNSRLTIRRAPRGANVAWTVLASCREGWINVPCRYMNLMLQRSIQQDLTAGLARLKALAEQLPDVDFEGLAVEMLNITPQPYLSAPATVSTQDASALDTALARGVELVRDFMADNAMVASGPLVRVTTNWDQRQSRISFNIGYPFDGPAPLNVVGVQVGQTPSGRAMRIIYQGPRSGTREVYARAYAYLQAHRIPLREDGLPWEVVLSDETAANMTQNMRLAIYLPLQ